MDFTRPAAMLGGFSYSGPRMTQTDQAIEQMVDAFGPMLRSERERKFVRDGLRNLCRLAQAEQLLQMRLDVNRAIGGQSTTS
jgi:hypothetical protein